MQTITKIAITGGPCAGKTSAMARIVDHFSGLGVRVFTVPEAATLLAQSGVDFLTDDKSLFLKCEMELMQFQMEMEDRICRIAEHCGSDALVVCDRGTMDLRAYLDDEMWQSLLESLGTTAVELRDARYAAVIHMVTAANGAEHFYTLANNAVRSESPELACAIDDRLKNAWTGHPHLRVVGNDCTFEEKLTRVLSEISNVLGIPEPIETERKYLVDLTGPIPNCNVSLIRQTYLLPVDGRERRLRARGENGHNVYFLTTKVRLTGDSCYEYERRIDENTYRELLTEANPAKRTVVKRRHCFLWKDQYFELDLFEEPKLSHYLLEIENASSPDEVIMPPFVNVVEDVTGNPNYYNSNLAKL